MAFLTGDALSPISGAAPGLQLIPYWASVSEKTGEDARSLLSHIVSGLVSRGWVHPLEKTLELSVDGLGLSADRVQTAAAELDSSGLIQVDDGKIRSLAGLFSTTPTRITYFMEDDLSVHLLGALAALAVPQALGRPGELMADCGHTGSEKRLKLECDEEGVHSRIPETVALFLPDWGGEEHPADIISGGGLFADDEALAAWQAANGEPEGMPLASMMFPMAASELGSQLGNAICPLLDRFANFG
jgi:hypothetical protein